MLDFDLHNFLEDMRACKPPYKCPYKDCGKVYKTYQGIVSHIQTHDGVAGGPGGSGPPSSGVSTPGGLRARTPSPPPPFYGSPVKDSLFYHEAEKRLEFEADGRVHRFSIYEPMKVVERADWEASLPPGALRPKTAAASTAAEDDSHKEDGSAPAAASSTPSRPHHSKKKKSLKGGQAAKPASSTPALPAASEETTEKRLLKLPEAQFSLIEDYDIGEAPARSASYYRFIERTQEEQDEEVEYDMDEEDVAWLQLINERRQADGIPKISEDDFELLMDRLEKESYFHVQTNGSKDFSAPIDDDAICCVCMDGECSNTNVILFCDLCNLAVHQECYGVPYIPEGQWLCRRCLQSPSRSVDCCLCPNKGGAFKQTDDGRWAHVVCGLWIPEVRFANTVFLEPIDSIDNIPPARWKLSCRVCKQRGVGACIQCHKTNCYTAFHVTCGLLAGLHMKMDTVKESSANGLSVTVRKTAYCDVHTPADSDCKPKLDDVAALGISTPKMKARSPKKMAETSPLPVLFRGLMNFSPQCPWDKVQEIAGLISVQRKNQFFQRLMAYWTLKRQTRNGVPLIRRLQFAKAMRPDKKPETPQKNAHHSQHKKKEQEKSQAKKAEDEFKEMLDQRKDLRRVRQDLERVRLLCELIRKREQRKRELIVNKEEIANLRLWPFITFLRKVMENMVSIDHQQIFAEPVSLEDVPDYLDHIKKPMDLQTMGKKLEGFAYKNIDEVEADFTLMVGNCMSYNERDTIFFRAGVKMRDQGGSILRQARRQIEKIGYDPETGVHTDGVRAVKNESVSDDKLMKEIDDFVNGDRRDEMPDEAMLKKLLEMHDKANYLHHPVAKVKRLKLLKLEITKTRRKLSMDRAGTSPGFKPKTPANHGCGDDEDDDGGKATTGLKKKNKTREVSPVLSDAAATPGRRLRAGKEIDAASSADKGKKSAVAAGRKGAAGGSLAGKKRARLASCDASPAAASTADQPLAKKRHEDHPLKTPLKHSAVGDGGPSPAKSPIGVNRRTAVLFTRKKQHQTAETAAAAKTSPLNAPSSSSTPAATTASAPTEDKRRTKKQQQQAPPPQPPPKTVDEHDLEEQETEVQSPASPPPVLSSPVIASSASAVGSTASATAAGVTAATTTTTTAGASAASSETTAAKKIKPKKKRGRKPRGAGPSVEVEEEEETKAPTPAKEEPRWRAPPAAASLASTDTASFQQYRRGGGDLGETDDDTQSESATDALGTSEDDDDDTTTDDSDTDDSSSLRHPSSALRIPLEPLDLVWAKCRGYPWYPALIINPKMPRTGYLHNGVPIPVPPQDVLDMAHTHASPHYLILFFDAKRTWQWLQRDKLEPLGVDSELDKAKLVQSKKPSERKAVKKAYEDAILHRCRVTGENAAVSESSEDVDEDEET